jgi:hypothetical protein
MENPPTPHAFPFAAELRRRAPVLFSTRTDGSGRWLTSCGEKSWSVGSFCGRIVAFPRGWRRGVVDRTISLFSRDFWAAETKRTGEELARTNLPTNHHL